MPQALVTLRSEPYYRRQAVVDGLRRLGYAVTIPHRLSGISRPITLPDSRDDLLCVWNLKAGYDERDAVNWERRGGTVLVFENAYLQKVDKSTYAISVHGHNGSGWFPHDPAEDRFTRLEFPQQSWREAGGHTLICGQRGIGSKLMASPAAWGERMYLKLNPLLKDHAPRLRPHPGNWAPKTPLTKDLEDTWACVVWSSSAGVRALTLGIPVISEAPHWICKDVAHDWRKLVTPGFYKPLHSFDKVRASLNRMAHGQWTVDEIARGEPFARMKAQNWGVETWA